MPKQGRLPHIRLKAWRDERGLNQKQAADLAGFGQGTWSFLERGERTPSLQQAFRLEMLTQGSRDAVRAADWLRASDLRPTG